MYLTADILLLLYCCTFETFRTESINSFELDPTHHLSTPAYSWDAMLKFADVHLKLISKTEKYQFLESTIRGDISVIWKGHAEANNKFLKFYGANKHTAYIKNLDANDLYQHLMMQLLPTEILHWVNPKDFNLDNSSKKSPIGCFLDVDLDYPNELHDLHNDYTSVGE